DVDDIHALRRALEDWMADRGVDQWARGSLPRERVATQVDAGEWWVLRDDEGVAATIRLLWSDPDFWGDDPTPAVYVHGLMVARRRSGDGLGSALLDWAAARGRDAGVGLFRLDCRTSNPALRRYYESQGFTAVGERDFGTHRNTLLERPLRRGTIGFLHTADAHVPTFDALTVQEGLVAVHVVEPRLLDDVGRVGPDDADVRRGTQEAVDELARRGADVVVCTCSSLGPVADGLVTDVPVLRVDRPMARAAVASGRRVGVVATVGSTLGPTCDLVRDEAERSAGPGAATTVVPVLVDGAWDAFRSGDVARHASLVAAAVRDLAADVDVVVLAQASMHAARPLLDDLPVPVLTSPATGVAAAARLVDRAR
ncbi:GNAT family N-acetyltransferase, partial [Cellulomonas algicola]